MDSTPPSEAEAEAVIAGYFTEQLAAARAEADRAAARLDQAEAEAAAFAERRELPPAVGAMRAGWDVATWTTGRTTRIASAAIDGKATREDYDRAKAEHAAVMSWLEAHGYEVPGAFRS